jgi:LPXTG-site transpeptidase (sortase) family protein
MQRRPLLVGAVVAIVGAALILLWVQRSADATSEAAAPTTTSRPTVTTVTPTSSPSVQTPSETATRTPTETAAGTPESTPATSVGTAEPPPSTAVSTGATLRIPGIDLAAGLHPEGLREGRINPPAGTVMWFTGYDRVAPGAVGTSVIAGHVVAGGRSDVFANLSRVRVGDRVELAGTDGTTRAFTVVRAGVVDKNDLTTDQTVWGGNSSVRRLAIITCDDAYGFRGDGHRVANYVVIAEPA